jgi:hypothetical protein
MTAHSGILWRAAALATAAVITATGPAPAQTPMPLLPPYLGNFNAAKNWGFEPNLTSTLPGDVFVPMKTELESKSQFSLVQRLFDLWSWQAFLAVNWPTNSSGTAAPSITGYNAMFKPLWGYWYESDQIYLPNGGVPAACGQPLAAAVTAPRNLAIATLRGLPAPPAEAASDGRLLLNVSAVGELIHGRKQIKRPGLGPISETNQAFSGPLYDQNGNPTFYEILMNSSEVNYLCAKKLYNINGQITFSADPNNVVTFPSGEWQTNGSGAFELKLAWKVLVAGKDKPERFYTAPAKVLINGQWVSTTVGLVGMHIAHKSKSSPQWIWPTFEQIDNIQTDPVANPDLNPSYFNPNCPACLVNEPQLIRDGSIPNTPTQVLRTIPIPLDKQALNREVQAALKAQNSVWQYYQLIDTQWPTSPTTPPTPPGDANLPLSVVNKPGGNPTPVYLTNATMETYFQKGNQNASKQEEGSPPSQFQLFATESCMGCHSSAGIAQSGTPPNVVYSGQLTADFSWLMQMKAAYATAP